MKQYESYKESNLPSVGIVPADWGVVPIKYVLEQSSEGIKIGPFGSTLTGKVSSEHSVKVYGQWNVIGKDFTAGKNYVTEETYKELESYWIHPNDVLISMMGTVGKCAIIPNDVPKGIMDSHIVKVRLNENLIDPQYFYYVYDKDGSKVVMSQIQRDRRGSIMDGLNSSLIKGFLIPLPSLSEQHKIVSFLEYKVGQIDSVIAEKEQMLQDLTAYRSSVISEAVTKGLNKDVPMKDSRVASIGTIPNTWKVVPIKYVLEHSNNGIKIGPFGSALTGKVSTDNDVKVYGQWNVIGRDFSAGKNYVSEETYRELESYWIHPNDVLISMMGTVAKCAIIPEGVSKGIMDSHIVKIRLNESLMSPKYFYYVYDKDGSNVVMTQIQRDRRGSIMDGLNSTLIKNFEIPLPSLSEQKAISDYLDVKVGYLESIISELQLGIEDLKSYKSSVITEAVTGKVDLREWNKQNVTA